MENYEYLKDTTTRVKEMLQAQFGDQFKSYYDGESEPGEYMLPCIMVDLLTTDIDIDSSATDDIIEEIAIIVSLNRKDDYGAPGTTDLTRYKLRKLVFGQNEATNEYLPQSVMGVLRSNWTLDNVALANKIAIDFTPNIRNNTIPTSEAYITITTRRQALVQNRT